MEVNIPKLRGAIAEKGLTVSKLATKAGISKSTLSRKIASFGKGLTVAEMHAIVEALELDGEGAQQIFLFKNSHKCELGKQTK